MDLNQIIKEEKRIKETIDREYADPANESELIHDGIVNPELYLQSKPRILWILKEPYDNGEKLGGAEDGGWPITKAMNEDADKVSRGEYFSQSAILIMAFGRVMMIGIICLN